jgi:D-3-phosphoglycerate dehydrogenase
VKTRILVTDGIGKTGVDLLKTHPDFETVIRATTSTAELVGLAPDFDALIVRTPTTVSAEVFKASARLKLVVASGAGFDNIDVDAAKAAKVTVFNCPTANALSAAEQTIGLMFGLARNIPQSFASLKSGKWERGAAFTGTELHGKILGILGLGNVGKIVAEKAMALGMLVVAYDPLVPSISLLPDKYKYLEMRFKLVRSMEEVLKEADWLTMHIPKEKKNIGLLNPMTIAQLRKGAYLINTSRGGIVEEKALLAALKLEHLAGAATDVFNDEPPKFDDPITRGLLEHPRFIATAHLGGATEEAKERVAAQAAQQVLAFFNEGARLGGLDS